MLSPRAAALFGLEVLADRIGDLPGNRTRFLIVARPGSAFAMPDADESGAGGTAGVPRSRPMRSTIVLSVRNEPGALLAVLRALADHGINMSKIESRPSRERAWEYVFWVDLDADAADPAAAAALTDLRVHTAKLRVLGSYPRPAEPA